jgi:sugar-specific transcriptional regulator TrmB
MLTSEWMCMTLAEFGFGRLDAEVYVFLVLNGPNNALAIESNLGLEKHRIYQVLRNLEKRQFLNRSQGLPALFIALPFDRLLDLLAKENLIELKRIEKKKIEVLNAWFSYTRKSKEDKKIKESL